MDRVFKASVVGSPETVKRLLHEFIARTNADEIIVATQVFEHARRLRSYEIVAEAMELVSSPDATAASAAARGSRPDPTVP